MKKLAILTFVFLSTFSFSQEEKNKCFQMPFSVVDEKPELLSDLKAQISEAHPESFGDETEHKGTFKVVVDCNGEVISVMYREGNYTKQEEVWMFAQLNATEWKPGVREGKEVSTTVFVTVTTEKLETELTVKLHRE